MIGLHAPYTWSTRTAMALGLAELARGWGYQAGLYADWACDSGYDPDWDSRVRNSRTFLDWAVCQRTLVWLSCRSERLWDLRTQTHPMPQVYVLDYTRLVRDEYDLAGFDAVLAPNSGLADHVPGCDLDLPVMRLDWDPGGAMLRKTTRYDDPRIWLYIPLQSAAAVRFGPRLFAVLEQVCRQIPELQITIAYLRRWSRPALAAIRQLVRSSQGRVHVARKPSRAQQRHFYQTHDWTFYPYYYDDVAWPALESLYCGTPVMTFRSAVTEAIVVPGHNGHLLHAELQPDEYGLPLRIQPDFLSLQFELCETLQRRREWDELVQRPWPELELRRKNFQESWQSLWRGLERE